MPLDGLSFTNSGIYKVVTPTEVVAQVEQVSQVQAEIAIKKVDKDEETQPDIEDSYEDGKGNSEGRDTEDNKQDGEEKTLFENEENIKKYRVKFNQTTNMVELIDRKLGTVIETVSPDDLVHLISKSRGTSGILVDKEI